MFLRKLKWFRKVHNFYQRGKKGYCNEDLWDLYNWFTGLFPKMLDDFLKNSHGYPCPLTPPSDIREQKEWYEDQQKKWEYEVKKLIWELKEANDETCSQKNKIFYDVNFEFVKTDKSSPFFELKSTFPTTEDEIKSKEHREREQEIIQYKAEHFKRALEQFEKIARDLWD